MQYNYDFHLHYQLVNASQMFRQFESFHCNRNVHDESWYGKLNFLASPHLIWCIDYQIPGIEFLLVLKKVMGKAENCCFSTSSLRKPWDLCHTKLML